MIILWAEVKDAQTRLTNVYISISRLVKVPPDFLFNQDVRNKLLLEDNSLTYTRINFWSYQSLASINEDIKTILTAYRDTFTDSVWGGFSGIIWPVGETSTRNINWREQMTAIKNDVERELQELESIRKLNYEKMKEINALRDNLDSGTSARQAQQIPISTLQGQNIRLLTYLTILFLPLTFVTCVFGMTNLDSQNSFIHFGIATIVICTPTYVFIVINTTSGIQGWWETFQLWYKTQYVFLSYTAAHQLLTKGCLGAKVEKVEPDPRYIADFDPTATTFPPKRPSSPAQSMALHRNEIYTITGLALKAGSHNAEPEPNEAFVRRKQPNADTGGICALVVMTDPQPVGK